MLSKALSSRNPKEATGATGATRTTSQQIEPHHTKFSTKFAPMTQIYIKLLYNIKSHCICMPHPTCMHTCMLCAYMCILLYDVCIHVRTPVCSRPTCMHSCMLCAYMCILLYAVCTRVHTPVCSRPTCMHS